MHNNPATVAAYYAKNRESILARNREYYREHRSEILARNRRRDPAQRSREYRRQSEHAMRRIAQRWGDSEPRCRSDTLPDGHPLRSFPCYGPLQIDHINGGGDREQRRKGATRQRVAIGRRGVHDLRILCILHQLWNVHRDFGPKQTGALWWAPPDPDDVPTGFAAWHRRRA